MNKPNPRKPGRKGWTEPTAEYYLEKTRIGIKTIPADFKRAMRAAKRRDLRLTLFEAWAMNRGYDKYDKFFSFGLSKSGLGANILDALLRVPRKKGEPLVIIDDGVGIRAKFLTKLKAKLTKKGIPSKTIGLTSVKNVRLWIRQKLKSIDELAAGPAELFAPKEPVDGIFSMYGSIAYALDALKKNHLLKLAYSLKKGGIMMVGFDPSEVNVSQKMMKNIETSFQKRGFKAKFYAWEEKRGVIDKVIFNTTRFKPPFPDYMLIVTRIK